MTKRGGEGEGRVDCPYLLTWENGKTMSAICYSFLLFIFFFHPPPRYSKRRRLLADPSQSKDQRKEIRSYGFKTTVVFEVSVIKMVYCFNDLCCHLHCKFEHQVPTPPDVLSTGPGEAAKITNPGIGFLRMVLSMAL